MTLRRWAVVLFVLLLWPLCAQAEQPGVSRALLIGVDEFVSRPSAYPSSANNVAAMQQLFERTGVDSLTVPDAPVTSVKALEGWIASAFAEAAENDTSFLYLSTHGVYEPQNGQPPALLLSDGTVEEALSPAQLQSALEDIPGTKVLILDACNSGAFIGKGLATPPEEVYFLGDDFRVLTSSGAMEESWYWNAGQDLAGQGAFYFTQALCEGLSARSGYPADRNSDGAVTLAELYEYLLLSHAASTPQVYPQADDTVLFAYDASAPLPPGDERSPVMDVTFSGSVLSSGNRQISIEFIATRPVRVAYQIVYQRGGKWQFDTAQLIYDQAERFTAFGDQPGAISAGRKLRAINLNRPVAETGGYVLVQLLSIDGNQLTVHAGRVICLPPEEGQMMLTASVDAVLDMSSGRELSIFIGHDQPCTLSVAIVDENENVIHRICHRQSTRPMQITPAGSVFYWDGTLRNGSEAPAGQYRVRAQAYFNDATVTVLSSAFTIQQEVF